MVSRDAGNTGRVNARPTCRLGVFLFHLLLPFALGACGRPHAGAGDAGAPSEERHSGPAVAVLDVSGGLPEQSQAGALGLAPPKPTFDDLLREITRVTKDKDDKAVLVRFGSAHIGLARAMELGDALADLGRTMPVHCHADGWSNATLYAAARGCRKIWVSPAGGVEAVGIAAQIVYFHKLLADTLGLTIDFLQVGKYKGAEEPFTRDGPSDEARQSLEGTLSELRAAWIDGVRAGRPGSDAEAPEDGPYSPEKAKERGLVDAVGYVDQARDALEKETGAVRDEVRYGPGSPGAKGDDLADILRLIAGESAGAAPIALVQATGAISMSGGGLFPGGSGGISEKQLGKTLARLEKDDDVKAVVLRIDSPGGSALASDLLWHALMRIRAKKPLVVSVGDMAASGGYYLASAGDVILADAGSIVGSIGVVGGKVAADKALERIGVHAETFSGRPGDAKAAARAAYGSVLMPWDEPTRARMLESMAAVYELFLSRVAEGRKMPVEKVRASAEGRIFGGREGKARGLVDEIGGLSAAVARARELAKLPTEARFAPVGGRPGLFDALGSGDDAEEERASNLAQVVASARGERACTSEVVARAMPEIVPFVDGLVAIVDGDRALTALPFALAVR
jgi:protease-4